MKKEKVKKKSDLAINEFRISIDDGFVEWDFKLKLGSHRSIIDIISKICKAFKVSTPEGGIRRTK